MSTLTTNESSTLAAIKRVKTRITFEKRAQSLPRKNDCPYIEGQFSKPFFGKSAERRFKMEEPNKRKKFKSPSIIRPRLLRQDLEDIIDEEILGRE